MTELFYFILRILVSPIERFWEKAETYKANNEYGKMILSFIVSLSLVTLMAFVAAIALLYLIEHHFKVVLIIGAIAWIYWTVKQKCFDNKPSSEPKVSPDKDALYQSAVNGYPHMRTIMFQTVRKSAVDIGGKAPRVLGEIEVMTDKFVINYETSIIYYQFRLAKQDIKTLYDENELIEFKDILQHTFCNLWQAGKFTQVSLQNHIDQHGNVFNPVIIDRIDDLGNEYLIQTVFTTPAYIELLRLYKENQTASQDVGYNPNDSRLL